VKIMSDKRLALLLCHRGNIDRYIRLLRTELTAVERDFIVRRLDEEQSRLDALTASTFPLAVPPIQSSGTTKTAA
jgi:hypothetical protein